MADNPGSDLLRQEDRDVLERLGHRYEVLGVELPENKTELRVIIHDYKVGSKYTPSTTSVMVRLMPGYPETPVDMFWTNPTVYMAGTTTHPNAADHYDDVPGKEWQRWSRHFDWRSGIDNLETFLAIVRNELA